MSFKQLALIEPLLGALQLEGYSLPTPIQQQAIPVILEGRDLLACAQTGTGKTAAFTLPMLQLLQEQQVLEPKTTISALILAPTRELAIQIGERITAYGKDLPLTHHVIFGGVNQFSQVEAIKRGIDILVATPGRLMDLLHQGLISLSNVRFFVLDEADRMLDSGFLPEIKRLLPKLPATKQTVLFSATMPEEIKRLAGGLLKHPVKVEVTPVSSTVDRIKQSVYFVEKPQKQSLLIELLKDEAMETVLVFMQMKHSADKLAKSLVRSGIGSESIHGNKSQKQRQNALDNFKKRKTRVLVATDIAARGIDIVELTHVINYELPNVPETYVHRIGRTGRAGANGVAVSFCDSSEKALLRSIQQLIGKPINPASGHRRLTGASMLS